MRMRKAMEYLMNQSNSDDAIDQYTDKTLSLIALATEIDNIDFLEFMKPASKSLKEAMKEYNTIQSDSTFFMKSCY